MDCLKILYPKEYAAHDFHKCPATAVQFTACIPANERLCRPKKVVSVIVLTANQALDANNNLSNAVIAFLQKYSAPKYVIEAKPIFNTQQN